LQNCRRYHKIVEEYKQDKLKPQKKISNVIFEIETIQKHARVCKKVLKKKSKQNTNKSGYNQSIKQGIIWIVQKIN